MICMMCVMIAMIAETVPVRSHSKFGHRDFRCAYWYFVLGYILQIQLAVAIHMHNL